MRNFRTYVGDELVVGTEITLDKAASHYLKHVLRLSSGATVLLFNGTDGRDYQGILSLDGRQVKVSVEKSFSLQTESPINSEIMQGLSRSDHMDWMIQKSTELGVSKISIFNAERTQKPPKQSHIEKKLSHWRAVAVSACEQCGRAIIPSIEFYADLDQTMAASNFEWRVLLDINGTPLSSVLRSSLQNEISILVGPEGGLNETEINRVQQAGFESASLGPRVLRTETAAITALSMAQSSLGDLV